MASMRELAMQILSSSGLTDRRTEDYIMTPYGPVRRDAAPSMTGLGEAAATIGTALPASVPAGLAGLGQLAMTRDPAQAAQAVQDVQRAMTYMPQSEKGQEYVQRFGETLSPLTAPAEYMGQQAMDVTGSPLYATGVEMIGDPLNLLGLKGLGAMVPLAAKAGRKAPSTADVAEKPTSLMSGDEVFEETGIVETASPVDFNLTSDKGIQAQEKVMRAREAIQRGEATAGTTASTKLMEEMVEIPEGTIVDVRKNLNSNFNDPELENFKAQTIHSVPTLKTGKVSQSESSTGTGTAITYDAAATVKSNGVPVELRVNQTAREAIASKQKPKFPMAAVRGKYTDIEIVDPDLTLGFNPMRQNVFVDNQGYGVKGVKNGKATIVNNDVLIKLDNPENFRMVTAPDGTEIKLYDDIEYYTTETLPETKIDSDVKVVPSGLTGIAETAKDPKSIITTPKELYNGLGSQRPGNGRGRYSSGGLAPLKGAPAIAGATGPDPRLVSVAEKYAESAGIPFSRQPEYYEVNRERSERIAQAYEDMPHDPTNPKVKAAYEDLIRQTTDQYQSLIDDGYEFSFFDSSGDPYDGNPFNAVRDLRQNKRMAVYGTYDGYGTEGITGAEIADNPMLKDTGLRWKDQDGVEQVVTANDLFRAVHDTFGHGLEGAGFRARGEENAWQAHARLFTGDALKALTTETRGQNSWLNYGPFGETNRTAKLEGTVFAEQKTGLMPDWTSQEGR